MYVSSIYVCVCMYLCVDVYALAYVYVSGICVCVCTYVLICIFISMFVYVFVFACAFVRMYLCAYLYIRIGACFRRRFTFLCVCEFVYVLIGMYVLYAANVARPCDTHPLRHICSTSRGACLHLRPSAPLPVSGICTCACVHI